MKRQGVHMKIYKSFFVLLLAILTCLICSANSYAIGDEKGETPGEEYEYESEEASVSNKDYMRLYYTFGVGGSYFARKSMTELDGTLGAYGSLEFRFSRLMSAGFDSNYGYLFGSGNQYLSIFNVGVKLFPMMYRKPAFEPFLFAGGKIYDAVFGASTYDRAGYGQGGFAGAGMRFFPSEGMMGIEFFARAEFLHMGRPKAVGGKGLTIPIYMFGGMVF